MQDVVSSQDFVEYEAVTTDENGEASVDVAAANAKRKLLPDWEGLYYFEMVAVFETASGQLMAHKMGSLTFEAAASAQRSAALILDRALYTPGTVTDHA